MHKDCTKRNVVVLCLLFGSLLQLGSGPVAPEATTLTGVSFESFADGSEYLLRLHADAEIPWYSHTELPNSAGIKVTLLNSKLAANASLDDVAGPFRSYKIYQEGGKVVLEANFIKRDLDVTLRPDDSSHDMLLIVSQSVVNTFATEVFQSSSGQSLSVLETLAAESENSERTSSENLSAGSDTLENNVQMPRSATVSVQLPSIAPTQKISAANPVALPERSDFASASQASDGKSSRKMLSDVDRLFSFALKNSEQQDVSAETPEPRSVEDRWKLDTVVLDAGHGGWDVGAFGVAGLLEKDLALNIAKLIGVRLEKELGINVVYTRSDDRFVTLADRGHIANQAGGKLFLSIHANFSSAKSARGTETYFLGTHRSDSARVVMERENEVIKLESDQSRYNTFDNAALAQQALAQSSFMRHSEILADAVQKQFADAVGRKDRGVKQAGFYVLFGASMPAVLIELGFLTNPYEEKFLSSKDGQTSMADAIFRAVLNFKKDYEESLQVASY